jgi:hypothetical protein
MKTVPPRVAPPLLPRDLIGFIIELQHIVRALKAPDR